MKRLIAGSAALLGVIAVPAQAQSLGAIVNSVFGSGYSQPYYGYQPTYNYGYQPSNGYYGYQQSYGYQQPYGYSRSYNGYGYNSYNRYGYQRSYGYYRGRDYEHRRHGRRHHRHENDENQDEWGWGRRHAENSVASAPILAAFVFTGLMELISVIS